MSDIARGWRSRGRLPHADFPGCIQAMTFRLADALPSAVVERLRERTEADDPTHSHRALRHQVHAWLDAGHGAGVLARPLVRAAVVEELHRRDGQDYRLEAYTIMPNHVHAIATISTVALGAVVGRWKGASARAIHRLMGGTGALWGREYYDRYIRSEGHLVAALRYVVQNAVSARLVVDPWAWPGLWMREELRMLIQGAGPSP